MSTKIMMFDLNIKLYSPHREYILTELFDHSNFTKVIKCTNTPFFKLSDELNRETSKFKPNVVVVDPWIFFEDKRDSSFLNANLVLEEKLDEKCSIISKFLINQHSVLKVILGGWMDVHSLSNKDAELMRDLLSRHDFYFWGLGKKSFVDYKQSDVEYNNAKRPHTKYFSNLILSTKLERKIIPYIHAIPKNFYHIKLNERQYNDYEFDFHVPGSLGSYPERRKAQEKFLKYNNKDYFNLLELNFTLRKILYKKNQTSF